MSSRLHRASVAAALLFARMAAAQAPASPSAPAAPAPAAPAPAVSTPAASEPVPSTPAAPEPVPSTPAPPPLVQATDATSPERTARDHGDGQPVTPTVPHDDAFDRGDVAAGDPGEDTIESGVVAVLRIDGKGRGFAAGAGLAISRGNYEFELMMLKSDVIGGYLGVRYRVFSGAVRPYLAAGAPGFLFDHDQVQPDNTTMTTTRLSIGMRVAAGVELRINDHLSVQGDLGYEHFFFLDDTDPYETDVFVPTLGVIGRL